MDSGLAQERAPEWPNRMFCSADRIPNFLNKSPAPEDSRPRAGNRSRTLRRPARYGPHTSPIAALIVRRGLAPGIAAAREFFVGDMEMDTPRIAGFYAELAAAVRSPIIELNRAVAVGMAEGPEAGLSIVDRLMREPALKGYHLLPSVRGDLLHKLGRYEEARAAFEAAAALANNRREHDLLRRRAAEAADAAMPS